MLQKKAVTEPIITVGILSALQLRFVLNGDFLLNNETINGDQSAEIQNGSILFNGIHYKELLFETHNDNASFELQNVIIGIDFHWERKENQRFKGDLKLIIENDKITAINRIQVEDYLTSVISSEMSATASDELLKAHAVISRSWLLKPLQDKRQKTEFRTFNFQLSIFNYTKWYERDAHTNFDVCADDHCQRYQGITKASTEAVEKAIEATRGQVLVYNNEICDARFSKCCGGASESFENCWAPIPHPYLTKVIDNPTAPEGFKLDLTVDENAQNWIRKSPEAYCNTTDKKVLAQVLNNYDQETTDFYRWKVVYSQTEIAELLCRRSGIDFGKIIDLTAIKRGKSGRIIELKIMGTKQSIIVGKELEIRKWLSNSHLYSSAFVVDKEDIVDGVPQKFKLTGAGWGHGVGLCQIGAAMMGEKGYQYEDILMHYFKNIEIKIIYP